MEAFFKRPIEGSFPAMMMDGLGLGKITIFAARGIGDRSSMLSCPLGIKPV